MRKINFRAWIKPDPEYDEPGRMTPVSFLGLPMDDEHTWQDEELPNKHGQTNDYEYSDDYVLMESTGLYDKKKKEIFEGDILEHDLWGRTYVIWEHGMFRATNDKEDNMMVDVTMADHQLARTRVIGNIYENFELLG